jgi:hypothetical protein
VHHGEGEDTEHRVFRMGAEDTGGRKPSVLTRMRQLLIRNRARHRFYGLPLTFTVPPIAISSPVSAAFRLSHPPSGSAR